MIKYKGKNRIKLKKATERKSQRMSEFLPEDKEIKILDIGCGLADITNYLFELGYKNIEGFDIDEYSIKKAKENYPKVKLYVFDAFDIDYSKYDVVYAFGSFYYMRDVEELLEKISKEMKQGSLLIFATPNICSLNNRIKTLFGISPLIGRGFHPVYPLTFKKAEELIKPLDFREKKIIKYHNDGKLNFMPIRNLSSHIIVRMKK